MEIDGLSAQTQPPLTSVIPPSPTAAAMQQYGDFPVSPYTGLPTISIPLYTIKYHDITIPVSISYHASGIKVAEEASNVGLGWVLNAGGAITRNIIGYDDFFTNPTPAYFNNFSNLDIADGWVPDSTVQPSGKLSMHKPGRDTMIDISSLLGTGGSATVEFQPDQFYYNVQGLTGKFLLRRNFQPILQTLSKVDISVNTDGSVWDMKTPDGFLYHFSQKEVSRSTQEATGIQHISAVYLTSITSPTGNVVTFNYGVNTNNYVQSIGSYIQSRDAGVIPGIGEAPVYIPGSNGQGTPQLYNTVYLTSIDYSTGQVKFNYSHNRTDVTYDNQLDSINVYTKDNLGNLSATPFKTVSFSYSYVSGSNYPNPAVNSTAPNYSLRLQLDSVTEKGTYNGQTAVNKPYIFTYNNSTAYVLPSKSSLGRDHWGYYNGRNNSLLIPNYFPVNSSNAFLFYWGIMGDSRNADGLYVQAFSLSDIKYPTGGTTHFDYEANDCDEQKSYVNDHTGTPFPFTIKQGYQSPFSNGWAIGGYTPQTIDLTDLYTNPAATPPDSIQVTFVFGNAPPITHHLTPGGAYLSVRNQGGTELYKVDPTSKYGSTFSGTAMSLTLPLNIPAPGVYQLVPVIDTNSYAKDITHVLTTTTWYTQVNSSPAPTVTHPSTYSLAGGLRILRITDNDGINPAQVKKYIYHYNVGQTPEYTYGKRMSRPEYAYWEESEDHQHLTGPPPSDNFGNSEHLMRVSDSDIPLNGSAQGMVVGYDQVTVNYGENGENGKTVYQYYNNPDVVLAYNWLGINGKRPYNSNIPDPLNGSLLQQTDYQNYAGTFIPVKRVINTYTKNAAKENYVYAVEDHIQPHVSWVDSDPASVSYAITNPYDRLINTYSTLQSDWTYQTSTDVKMYALNDSTKFQETLTNDYYDNPNHYLPTRTVMTNSKKEIITTTTKYPLDFTNLTHSDAIAPGVTNLNTNHIINAPVEKYVQKTDSNGTHLRTVSALLTGYSASGISVPNAVYQMQSTVPYLTYSPYATSGLIDTAYHQVFAFDHYDLTNGDLLQQHKTYDVPSSYLWSYSKQYPVAEVKNAAQNDIFFDSFEDGDGNSTYGDSKTGHYSYNGTYTKALSGLDAGTYTETYWKKTGGVWAWQTLPVTVSGSTYTISLSGQIDDVRFYPSAAQMTTYTYDRLTGMTSSTDVKGEVTFYEYDGLQRLMNVKDKDGNIIKHMEYHYQGQ